MKYYLDYVNALGGNQEILEWIETVLKKRSRRSSLEQAETEHVLDYLLSESAPTRLKRMSYDQAKMAADHWSKANQKRGRNLIETESDLETIHAFEDGSKIVRLLTKTAFQREGFMMAHCVGGYNPTSQDVHIYSYRDKKNIPHATFEIRKKDAQIVQIKGKGNGSIHPRYIHPIVTFLKKMGINVRSSEMANLGYYHIPGEVLEFLNQIVGAKEEVQEIFGEKYLYWSGRFA